MAARKVGSRVRGQRGSLGHVTGRMGGWGRGGVSMSCTWTWWIHAPWWFYGERFCFHASRPTFLLPVFFFKLRFTPSHLKDIYIFYYIYIFICRAVGLKSLSWSMAAEATVSTLRTAQTLYATLCFTGQEHTVQVSRKHIELGTLLLRLLWGQHGFMEATPPRLHLNRNPFCSIANL